MSKYIKPGGKACKGGLSFYPREQCKKRFQMLAALELAEALGNGTN